MKGCREMDVHSDNHCVYDYTENSVDDAHSGVTYWLGALGSGDGHRWLEKRSLKEDSVI